MTLEEIYQLDPKERITELKKRKLLTPLPDASALLKDWDEKQHKVMDEDERPKRKVLVEEEIKNASGRVTQPARYEKKEVNRIALPLEQDIVNIHTAFTVGIEPKMTLLGTDEKEKNVFDILKSIYRQNKMKFHNKKVVRAWLAETEVAEYWYTVEDSNWWKKILNTILKVVGRQLPTRKLKVAIWSPFRGDKLYPYFDDYGDLIVISREYKSTDVDGQNEVTKFMTIDKTNLTMYKNGELDETAFKTPKGSTSSVPHGFEKIPVIYMYRERPFCDKIKTIRERLETLLSNFADCLDYNFFPKLMASGIIEGVMGRNTGSEIIQLENEAKVAYLTWEQSPDMAKLEFDNLTERAYSLTNTPRISFENLKGAGNAFSGVSFRYAFMGTHMAVSNHAESVEEYIQRRVNFIVSATGSIYPSLKDAADQVEIETEIVPYMIDNIKDKVDIAVSAVEGGVASTKTGILLAGLTDKAVSELEEIKSDSELKNKNKMLSI